MGGAETQLLLLARLLLEHGRYGVRMATLDRSGVLWEEARRLPLGEIPEYPLRSFYDRNMLAQTRRFAAFLRAERIAVVHTEGFYTNIFGMAGAAWARVPARIAFRGETAAFATPRQLFVERAPTGSRTSSTRTRMPCADNSSPKACPRAKSRRSTTG